MLPNPRRGILDSQPLLTIPRRPTPQSVARLLAGYCWSGIAGLSLIDAAVTSENALSMHVAELSSVLVLVDVCSLLDSGPEV
jgi:hypothetical protein